jgi:Uma2 family endonuclease
MATIQQEGPTSSLTGQATAMIPAAAGWTEHDDWVQVPATWGVYLRLLQARGERPRPRYTFFNKRLTIVSPGPSHEARKKRVGVLIEDMFLLLKIRYQPYGSETLLKQERSRAGTEGDDCYYLNNIAAVRGKDRFVMGQDPPPDLAVEVVISHPEGDALDAYRTFGVREVWVCKRSEITFLVLGPDGQYAASPTSACLPFLTSEELTPWVFREDLPDEFSVRELFRAWVLETLAPRLHANPPGNP